MMCFTNVECRRSPAVSSPYLGDVPTSRYLVMSRANQFHIHHGEKGSRSFVASFVYEKQKGLKREMIL